MPRKSVSKPHIVLTPVPEPELRELVMGVHWDPLPDGSTLAPADLDSICMLLDAGHKVITVVHPGQPRNGNESVVHTGDAQSGASVWDDERIFVFLDALPPEVTRLTFIITSTNGRLFNTIAGVSCHISDRVTERAWIKLDGATLGPHTACHVATLDRSDSGWKFTAQAHPLPSASLPDILAQVQKV